VLCEEVEDVHAAILYLRRVSLLAVALAFALPQHGVLVPGRSLGGIELGMTQSQVERAWGTSYGRCRNCARTTWYFNYDKFHAEGAAVRFRKARVDAVWTLWKPDGWRAGNLALGAPAPAITGAWGALVTIPCGSYEARVLTRRSVTTVFYVYGGKLWGFGLNRSDGSPCH
jgi:hypothetical protein